MTMVISGSDGVTFPDSTNQFSGGAFSFKNRIINGDMRIAQRGTAAVTTNGSYAVDRFFSGNSTDGAFSAQQDSSAPAGFVNSVKVTTTTADGTLTTTQALQFRQIIEGTNIADLGWGSANAKTVTLSFWVRSSLTGSFGGSLRNSGATRSYPFSYTISVADTWEYKTVTIAGDTSGTWLATTGTGIEVIFGLGAGPDRSGTAGAWAGSSIIAPTGAVSVIGTLNATWYITGVQLEVGSVATPFERRPYGLEFDLCRRYCEVYSSAGAQAAGILQYLAQVDLANRPESMLFYYPKRANPTITVSDGTKISWSSMANTDVACTGFSGTLVGTRPNSANLFFTTASGVTTNTLSGVGFFIFNDAASIVISAEL